MKVCVVGLGEVGMPTAAWISHFHEIYAYDPKLSLFICEDKLVGFRRPYSLVDKFEHVPLCNTYIICTPTETVESACMLIPHGAKLVAVESTVEVGTCKRIYEAIGVPVVHCPHRWWKVDPVNHGVRQVRVLGGVTEKAVRLGIVFYQGIEIPLHVVRPVEVAELSKIVENAYEYLKIAFAEELSLICRGLNLPYDQVRQACNTNMTQDIKLMEARDGIDGKCLPWAAGTYAMKLNSDLVDAAIGANVDYIARRDKIHET